MFPTLKQCLSGHFIQIFKFMSNTLKKIVGNLFHSPHIKESKKNISCNGFIKKELTLREKNKKKVCFPPLKQCLSGHLMQFFKIHVQYIKNYHGNFISYSSHQRTQKSNITYI